MKNILSYAVVFSLLSFPAACNRDNDDDINIDTNSNPGKFEFYANDVLHQMNKGVDVHDNTTTAGNILNVAAYNSDNTGSAVGGIANYTGPDTYDLSADSSNYIAFTINSKTYYLTGGNIMAPKAHGVVIVTDETTTGNFKNTKGTFSGVAYASSTDSVVITGGIFTDDDF